MQQIAQKRKLGSEPTVDDDDAALLQAIRDTLPFRRTSVQFDSP